MSHGGPRATAFTAVALLLASCQAQAAGPVKSNRVVLAVEMSEYRFTFDTNVPAGRVIVEARNTGKLDHEMLMTVLPDDFPADVQEQLKGSTRRVLDPLAIAPRRGPGKTGTFAVDLAPGRYGLFCFLTEPGASQDHAHLGMAAQFRVA